MVAIINVNININIIVVFANLFLRRIISYRYLISYFTGCLLAPSPGGGGGGVVL